MANRHLLTQGMHYDSLQTRISGAFTEIVDVSDKL